jgi:hypothetical protein
MGAMMKYRLIDKETEEILRDNITFDNEEEQLEYEEIAEHLGFYYEEMNRD